MEIIHIVVLNCRVESFQYLKLFGSGLKRMAFRVLIYLLQDVIFECLANRLSFGQDTLTLATSVSFAMPVFYVDLVVIEIYDISQFIHAQSLHVVCPSMKILHD